MRVLLVSGGGGGAIFLIIFLIIMPKSSSGVNEVELSVVQITLQDIINSKRALQKSCCLLCVIILSPQRVRPQLTPEENFGIIIKNIGC